MCSGSRHQAADRMSGSKITGSNTPANHEVSRNGTQG